MTKKKPLWLKDLSTYVYGLGALAVALLVINQALIYSVNASLDMPRHAGMRMAVSADLSGVDVTEIQTTAQGLAMVMDLEDASEEEVVAQMLPGGTPAYGEAMGVSYDSPIESLQVMARAYPALKADIAQNDPETYQRWIDLASAPRGISCEYCCSIGAFAIMPEGRDMCGCQHHPALQTLTLWLMQNTDYSDAEILREAYRWKTLFFPKDMIGLGVRIAGGDESALALPSMVGGC